MNPRHIARVLGRLGGRARAKKLSAEQKKKIASMGGRARVNSLLASRRMVRNFRYLDAVRKLRGHTRKVTAVKDFKGPLPGIYV